MSVAPRVSLDVEHEAWHMVGQRGELQRSGIERRMLEECLHTSRRHLLQSVGMAHQVEFLAPLVDLRRKIDLDGANVVARHTERTSRAVVVVGLLVLEHTEIDADRPWDEIGVGIASRPTIDGTGVHAGTATHALKGLPVLDVTEDAAASVIDEDDVHLSPWTCLAEVRRIDRGGLACSMTSEETLEDSHCLVVGNDLLQANGNDVQLGNRR